MTIETASDFSATQTLSFPSLYYARIDGIVSEAWVEVEPTSGSDIQSSSASKSNYAWFEENYAGHKDVKFLRGDHRSYAVLFNTATEDKELLEVVNSLSEYACLDDKAAADVQNELVLEAWSSWAERSFTDLVEKKFDKEFKFEVYSEDKFKVFELVRERESFYWEEYSEGMSINVGKVCEHVSLDDIAALVR